MTTLQLLFALGLPCLSVWVWLERVVPIALPARRLLLAGYSLLLGMIVITLVMRLLDLLGIPFSVASIGLGTGLLVVAGLVAPSGWRLAESGSSATPLKAPDTPWYYLLLALCLALIAARLVALGIEVGTRPVYAWDAKQHWAKQAKVFFELGSIAHYVPLEQWLTPEHAPVYTNMHPDYPITTPLLQAWTSIALGQWHDSLVNLPWLLMYIALGLVFYAQARIAGLDVLSATAGCYLLMSLPYLNIHVALAGYADLLLAACFLGAVAAFANWCITRNRGQAVLALLCAGACLLVKNEGFFWFLSLLPGLILIFTGIRRGLVVFALMAFGLLLLLWFLPQDLVIAGNSLGDTDLRYRPEGLESIRLSFLVHDNWHFLTYLLLASLLLLPLRAKTALPTMAPVAAVIVTSGLLYMALYLLTRHAYGAVMFTSLNRVALQLMPAAAFFIVLVYGALLREGRDKAPTP